MKMDETLRTTKDSYKMNSLTKKIGEGGKAEIKTLKKVNLVKALPPYREEKDNFERPENIFRIKKRTLE